MRLASLGCLVLLAACSQVSSDNRICTAPVSLEESLKRRDAVSADDPGRAVAMGEYVKSCVHRWAYRLAGTADPVEPTAKAALGACYDAITWWDRDTYRQARIDQATASPAFFSSVTGQPVTLERLHREELEELARFWIVQARAGRCPVPG